MFGGGYSFRERLSLVECLNCENQLRTPSHTVYPDFRLGLEEEWRDTS